MPALLSTGAPECAKERISEPRYARVPLRRGGPWPVSLCIGSLAATSLAVAAIAGVAVASRSWGVSRKSKGLLAREKFLVEDDEGQAACTKSGENCMQSKCCIQPGQRCYEKVSDNKTEFGTCLSACIPGVQEFDEEQYRTPWTCKAIGPRNSPPAEAHANAGCFIVREDGRLMLLRHGGYIDTWDIPGGTVEGDESPDMTATRETFEETGFRAMALDLMQVMENGFHIYRCVLAEKDQAGGLDDHEVSEVVWVYEPEIPEGPWRFPEERDLYRSWMTE